MSAFVPQTLNETRSTGCQIPELKFAVRGALTIPHEIVAPDHISTANTQPWPVRRHT